MTFIPERDIPYDFKNVHKNVYKNVYKKLSSNIDFFRIEVFKNFS